MTLEIALRSVALLSVALVATRLFRRSPALRHLIWSLSLAGLLLLPAASLLLPHWPLAVLPASAGSEVTVAGEAVPLPSPEAAAPEVADASRDGETTGRTGNTVPARPLSIPWLIGTLVFLGRLAGDRLRLTRLVRRSWRARASLVREIAHLARSVGLRRNLRVLESAEIDVPSTWGLLRPVLAVPVGFGGWESGRRRRIVLHELAHVRRNDASWVLVARLATALFWWNPLAWYAARSARQASEAAADARVLSTGERPSDYAEDLLSVARLLVGSPWLGRLLGIGRGRLRDRIERVLEPSSPVPPARRVVLLAASSTILAIAAMATVIPVRATGGAEAPGPDGSDLSIREGAEPPWPAHQIRWARTGEAGALFLEGDVDLASLVREGDLPNPSGLLVWFHRDANGTWTSLAAGPSGSLGRTTAERAATESGPATRALRRSLVEVAPDWAEHPDTSLGSLVTLPEIVDRPRLDFSGSVILGVPGRSRDPGTGVIQGGWYAEGERIGLFAHGPLELDAASRSLERLPDDGWLAVFGWTASTGRLRVVEALPGSHGEPELRYTDNGSAESLDTEARGWLERVLAELPDVAPGVVEVSRSG